MTMTADDYTIDDDTVRDDALSPTCFDEYIGQAAVKARIDLAIDAAVAANRPIEHLFLAGQPGVGKSTLARLVAAELDAELVEHTRPLTAAAVADVIARNAGDADTDTDIILFFDEIHGWNQQATEVLLPVVLERSYDAGYGMEPCTNISVFAATTEPRRVTPALRQRFRIAPVFDPYSHDDMKAIVKGMARRVTDVELRLDDDTIDRLAAASAGVPRVACSLVSTAAELAVVDRTVTADAVLNLCRIEADGLTTVHLDYLTVLHNNRGQAGLDELCATLDLTKPEARELERVLKTRGLMYTSPGGRKLTRAGRDRIR